MSDANLAQMPEFRQRVSVLRALQYIDADNTVEVKARPRSQRPCDTPGLMLSACSTGLLFCP